MKLLLDAMFAPAIAQQLRRRGHDVVAAIERPDLQKLLDPDLFAAAQVEQRTMVTENVPDFLDLDGRYRQSGHAHYGLVLTTDKRFDRGSPAHIGRLVTSLDALLRAVPAEPTGDSAIHWLR